MNPFSRVNATPIFIIGNQKGGTTVIAALLAKLTSSSLTLQIRTLDQETTHQLRSGKLAFAYLVKANKSDFSKKLIKDNNLSFFYSKVESYFPEARFVLIVRDPRDNIRSILNRLKLPGTIKDQELFEEKKVPVEWKKLMSGNLLLKQDASPVEVLAEHWNLMAELYLNNKHKFHLVYYEDFLADKARYIETLSDKLDLRRIADIRSKVDIQYESKGKRNVNWLDFFGRENLDLINRICGVNLHLLGYEIASRAPSGKPLVKGEK